MEQANTPFYQKPETNSKKFWRIVLGTMVGFILTEVVISFLSLIFMIGIISSFSTTESAIVKDNSILKLNIKGELKERSVDNPFSSDFFNDYIPATLALDDMLACIEAASNDSKIKGISLNISYFSSSPAMLKELRDALEKFKESGKFIYAYADSYSQGGYYLASLADKIFINRLGNVDIKGISMQVMFYKGFLDKANLDIQVIRHGQFKSAVEPYLLDKMSEANRLQMSTLANSLWNTMLTQISASRDISIEKLNEIADNLLCENAQASVDLGIADVICHFSEYEKFLKNTVGIDNSEDLNYIEYNKYKTTIKDSQKSDNKIAVIYAEGTIVDGKGTDGEIGSESFCKEIRKAYEDGSVKAIVLRVNSPGGSALASEIIWNEIETAKKMGKKVITSMSGYAASGGYYISCNSDYIVAQPNTLTGSIGVFGVIPSFQRCLETKLGITVDNVKTNEHSDYTNGKLLNDFELQKMTVMVEDVYSLFTQRVAAGRNMSVSAVDSIGQGRVWAGEDALKIGLVDFLGSLNDAIALAAKESQLEDYSIINYPIKQDWVTKFLTSTVESRTNRAVKAKLGNLYNTYEELQTIIKTEGVQAKLPFEITIE